MESLLIILVSLAAISVLIGVSINLLVGGVLQVIRALALNLFQAPVDMVKWFADKLEQRESVQFVEPVKVQTKVASSAPAMSPSGKLAEEVEETVTFMERKPDPLETPAYMRRLGLEADHFLKLIAEQNVPVDPEQEKAERRAKRDALKKPMSKRKQQLMSGVYSTKALSQVS